MSATTSAALAIHTAADGTETLANGTEVTPLEYGLTSNDYDPERIAPYWHQHLEMAMICIFNGMTLLLIIARCTVRRMRLGRFRKDDIWLMVAGVILVFPYWVSQIGTNIYGSGLHAYNIPPEWYEPAFYFGNGWAGYYIVASMIKTSVLYGFLEILPPAFHKMRSFVYVLCGMVCALGLAEAGVWLIQCLPIQSNFVYTYDGPRDHCVDVDRARLAWVGISCLFDICIVAIPFAIVRQIRLQPHERIVVLIVFAANFLGTLTCAAGAYAILVNNNQANDADAFYSQSLFIMITDVEIFMYTVGASATMGSRFFIAKVNALSSGNTKSPGKTTSARDWRTDISWPTSNDSYYTDSPVSSTFHKPSKASSGGSRFGSFGFKRGFKGSDVEILEGFDRIDSPRSLSSMNSTPRSGRPLLHKPSPSQSSRGLTISKPMLPTHYESSRSAPALQDIGGLVSPSTGQPKPAAAPAAPMRMASNGSMPPPPPPKSPHHYHGRRQNSAVTVTMPFTPVNWNGRAVTPPDSGHPSTAQPWEGQGPIGGWQSRR